MTTTSFGFNEIPLADKVNRVRQVFDSVAGNYDLMNDLMSLGIHRFWKWYTVHKMRLQAGDQVLDLAGGTGDLARLMVRNHGVTATICDINANMLIQGRSKLTDAGVVAGIEWVQGNAEQLPFADHSFQVTTIGFGIRNVTDIPAALREMTRVTRPGGQVVCLEFSRLAIPYLQPAYDAYSFNVLPQLGEWIAKDRASYQYLAESIRRFPPQAEFKKMMEQAGLFKVDYTNLAGGIAAVHIGYKV